MLFKQGNFVLRTGLLSGILLTAFLAAPLSNAGDASTLMAAPDRNVPEGSQISEWRIKQTEMKINLYKQKMKEMQLGKQQEQLPEGESVKPEDEEQ